MDAPVLTRIAYFKKLILARLPPATCPVRDRRFTLLRRCRVEVSPQYTCGLSNRPRTGVPRDGDGSVRRQRACCRTIPAGRSKKRPRPAVDITDVQSVDLELSFGAMLPADGAVIDR